MQVKEIYNEGKEILRINNIDDETTKSRILMCYVLNISKEQLIIRKEEQIKKEEKELFLSYINKIKNGTPLQYIVNNQEFMKLNFYVDENVLIPRSDTEILVEEVINIAKQEKENMQILDICTGSGVIGISLGKNLKNAHITMSDISMEALQIAKKNSEKHISLSKVEFIESNMFENITNKYDFIVSNPPYIQRSVIETLSKNVQKEPLIALDGGEDGLSFYKILANEAYKFLNNEGYLCMEIGYNQKEKVIEILKSTEKYKEIYSKKDLCDNDRIVIAKLK